MHRTWCFSSVFSRMVATRQCARKSGTSKVALQVAIKASSKPARSTGSSSANSPAAAPVSTASAGGKAWFEQLYSGAMSDEYKAYMRDEWAHEKRGDVALFEKLSLEGAQAGLSWSTILAKREAYRRAFHGFDLQACAAMTEADVDALVASATGSGRDSIVRHRQKVASVPNNARAVLRIIAEAEGRGVPRPPHGHFDAFLWAYVGDVPQLNRWPTIKDIPATSELSEKMSKELKKLGFSFVGPTICYSLLQSCGLIVDHPAGTQEWEAARVRLAQPGSR